MKWLWRSAIFLLYCGAAVQSPAHSSLPAFLELREIAPGNFDVLWRVPAVDGPPSAIYPVFPPNCRISKQAVLERRLESIEERASIQCGIEGLVNGRLEVTGLTTTITDVVVRITLINGVILTHVLRPLEPSFVVRAGHSAPVDAYGYVSLGIGHILGGIDHLLFVLCLMLVAGDLRALLKTITAFTAAHTITLGLAAFDLVRFPAMPVEATIALSIIFLAAELARKQKGREGLMYRRPAIVAFAFGLLHGFGFAGSLAQIGIPSGEIPFALLSFNVGVELGQIGFIVGVLAFFHSIRSLEIRWPSWTPRASAYAIGSMASYWLLHRCALTFAASAPQ
jgi:hypothetical protein